MKAALHQWKNMISDVIVNVLYVCTLRNVISMAGAKTSPTKPVIDLQFAREKMICEWNYISGIRALTNILFRFCDAKSSPVIFLPAVHNFKAKQPWQDASVCCLHPHGGRAQGQPVQAGQGLVANTRPIYTDTPLPHRTRAAGRASPATRALCAQSSFWRVAVQGTCVALLQVETRLASFLCLNK